MDLPHLFSQQQSQKADRRLFFALDIGEEVITAGLWSVDHGQVSMLKTSSPIEWEGETPSDVIEASDVALEELGPEEHVVSEVMFGLPSSWVENGDIVDDKKKILKELCEKLMIKPVGYVVTTEALNKFLCEQEGSPVHAILVEFSSQSLTISLVKAGNIERTEHVGRSTDSISDLLEGLARFNVAQLPLQILLYSARMKLEELEKEKQAILNYDWQSVKSFLHILNVEVLAQKIMIEAVCIAGGAAVAQALGLSKEVSQETVEDYEPVKSIKPETLKEVVPVSFKTQQINEELKVTGDDFGFEEVSNTEVSDDVSNVVAADEEVVEQEVHNTRRISLPKVHLPKLPSFSGISMPKLHIKLRLNVAMLLLPLVLVIGGFVITLFVLKSQSTAQVIAFLKTSPISVPVEVVLSPDESSVKDNGFVLKASEIEKDVEGEKSGKATGTRKVGDKASGKVTLFNATSSVKNFPSGTVLTSPQGLKFSLNDTVLVASSSGSASSIQPGTAEASVTALDIGAEFNISQELEFTVANFDKMTYVAKNTKPLTGGSSREVQVVSKDDQTRIRQELIVELKQKALDALKQEQTNNTQLVILDTGTIKAEKFSTDIGKEAQTLTLTMTYTARGLTYSPSDLKDFASKQFTQSLSDKTVLQEEKTLLNISKITPATGSSNVRITGDLSSFTIPVLDTQKIKEMLVSKTVPQAKAVLLDQSGVISADVKVTPSIVQTIFNVLPSAIEKISLETRVE